MPNHREGARDRNARPWALSLMLGLCLLGALPARAQTAKIGVVDVERITRRSSSIQDIVHKAEQNIQSQQGQIEAKLRDYQRLRDDLSQRTSVLSKTESDAREAEIRKLKGEIDDLQYRVNKELERIRVDVMDPEVERIMKTVEEVAKREGYDLVIRAEAALYVTNKVDLTPLVIDTLDRQKSGGGAKPATEMKAVTPPAAPPAKKGKK